MNLSKCNWEIFSILHFTYLFVSRFSFCEIYDGEKTINFILNCLSRIVCLLYLIEFDLI